MQSQTAVRAFRAAPFSFGFGSISYETVWNCLCSRAMCSTVSAAKRRIWKWTALDMSFWRKIVNDYREGFHGVISQPKSPKIANFGKPSENCLQSILKQKSFWV